MSLGVIRMQKVCGRPVERRSEDGRQRGRYAAEARQEGQHKMCWVRVHHLPVTAAYPFLPAHETQFLPAQAAPMEPAGEIFNLFGSAVRLRRRGDSSTKKP